MAALVNIVSEVHHIAKDLGTWGPQRTRRCITCKDPFSPVMVSVALVAVSTNRSPVSLLLFAACSSILCADADERSAPASCARHQLSSSHKCRWLV